MKYSNARRRDPPGHNRAVLNNVFAQSTGRGPQFPDHPSWLEERTAEYMRAYMSKTMSVVRYLYCIIVCAHTQSRNGMDWLGPWAENSRTDHDGLVGDRFTTRLLIASEFYVHVITASPRRARWRSNEGGPAGYGSGRSVEERTTTIET